MVRYTTAPETYDGFGVVTLAVVGTDRGMKVRRVEIQEEHLSWQEGRYASGLHSCLSEGNWKGLVAAGICAEYLEEQPLPKLRN